MEVIAVGARFFLGLTFLLAALPKLAAPTEFTEAATNYGIVPRAIAPAVFRLLPLAELACAISLLAGLLLDVAAWATAGLLIVFCFAVSFNLVQGRELDCGCGGAIAPRQIGWRLVASDALAAILAIIVGTQSPAALTFDQLLGLSGNGGGVHSADALYLLMFAFVSVLVPRLFSAHAALRSRVRAFDQAGWSGSERSFG